MRDSISLIANSGLQFYTFESSFDHSALRPFKVKFIERYDSIRKCIWFDEVVALPEERYARRSEMERLQYLTSTGNISDEINYQQLELLSEGEFFEFGDSRQLLKYFERKWIPIPFFKKNNINEEVFGPVDWVRIYFEKINEETIRFVLLVDTTTTSNPDNNSSPILNENPNENIYSICQSENLTLAFLDKLNGCEWVEDYISRLFYPVNAEPDRPFLKHIAAYIFVIRFFRSLNKLPQVHLVSDHTGSIDVDLVIDVGNSNTCALIFENSYDSVFNFNKVKKIEIQDLENPMLCYRDSFPTSVVFKEASFGSFNTELNINNKFQWPSPLRIGYEAERTINQSNVALKLTREVKTYNSSPKRYLWDNRHSTFEWEYHQDQINTPPKKVFKKGISEQLNSDGSLCRDGVFGTKSFFSRKSLMTFVYIELLCHALRQINSIEYRSTHGSPGKKRKIKRVTISCPTAMIKDEQIVLRECALEAMSIINNYNYFVHGASNNDDNYNSSIEVIPSLSDLKLDLTNLEKRKDWIYDEATSPQMVFIYGAIKHKFDGNPDLFFNLFGKENPNSGKFNKSVTIGSLDIGGGTSDLMICKYNYEFNEITTIRPEPLFWESFNLAGDDLLKDVIQNIILEGKINREEDNGCTGVIENYARSRGINDITQKLNGFFGRDSNNIGYKGKLMRVNFINQIAIPIALKYMENANSDKEVTFKYSDFFQSRPPSADLLNYFETHFEFRFDELVWKISPTKTNEIIMSVFSKLIRQIAVIINQYSCDIVVLSGRPCSFNALENLFLKYHPVSPNRLINLNTYWIGRWYPFADNDGYIADPKTVVSVGSLISLMGGKLNKLDMFRIDSSLLCSKLISTAEFIGPIKGGVVKDISLSPNISHSTISVSTIPFQLGFKRINSEHYPSKNLYSIVFNTKGITDAVERNSAKNNVNLNDAIESFKQKLRLKMPFRITISRDLEKDKEEIKIEEVIDFEQNEVPKGYFDLNVQTLPEMEGYWLDSGEFTLNVRN